MPGKTCTSGLLITEDGGEHWLARALPAQLPPSDMLRLFVLGPRSAAVGAYNLDGGGQRFSTADAGLTWQPVPAAGSDTAATIPDGGLLDVAGATDVLDRGPVLVAVAPDSGRMLPLGTKPPLTDPLPTSTIPLAGGWWLAGKDPATGRWALAVSRNGGRSWSVKPLPNAPDTMRYALMGGRGTTLYAVAGGEAQGSPPGLNAIFRSTDGGNTWEQTFQGGNGREPRSLLGYPVAAADGQLIIGAGSGLAWASQDGGHTFHELPSDTVSGIIRRTRGGYLASPSFGMSNVYKFSTDGVQWKEITVG
jgi:photosystem II stability/assembly factor-like uncharacterized protein